MAGSEPVSLKIDFISDVSCPWCAIGLNSLEEGLRRLDDAVEARVSLQPFELNPDMVPEGENIVDHISAKYGTDRARSAATRDAIRSRATEVGFDFAMDDDSRIYNTFDAHRLLHWAELQGRHLALKHALFEAYFSRGESPADHAVLTAAAGRAGLDPDAARSVLEGGDYAEEVRAAELLWRQRGINSVPAVIVNDRYLISGGQPADAYERALREIMAAA